VDFAGQPAYLTDARTGAKTPVPLFVAVFGASNYTYAEATPAAHSFQVSCAVEGVSREGNGGPALLWS